MPTAELRIISQIGSVIASSVDYHESLRRIMEIVAESLDADVASILMLNRQGDELVLEATFGFDQEAVHDVRMPVGHGIVGHVLRNLETVNVARKQDHAEFQQFGTPKAASLHGLLAVPLVSGGKALGVLVAERRKDEAFTPVGKALAEAIASPLATFARNAHLSDRVQGEAERTETGGAEPERILRGKPITDGVVRGKAYPVLGGELLETVQVQYTDDRSAEKVLFEDALRVAREDTVALQKEASAIVEEADAAIFYAHLLLLEDPTFNQRVYEAIEEGYDLRFALKYVYNRFERELSRLDNEMVRERLADLKDVIIRIYQATDELEGKSQRPVMQAEGEGERELPIAVARELLPSQLIRLPLAELTGIVCEQGGTTSHVAILARTLRIPMIVGVDGVMRSVRARDELILDCSSGLCYVNPGEEVLGKFAEIIEFHRRDIPEQASCALAVTREGTSIGICGNISLLNELPLVKRYGAHGVGLYRTEFMFMIRNSFPSEEEQYNLFSKVVEQGSEDGPVTIRLLDIGGDKPLPYVDFGGEDNPVLGWRGMRFLLSNPQYLLPHLRAILRASAHGRVNLLLPMVADLEELLEVRDCLKTCEEKLDAAGHSYDPDYGVGVMIEVPSTLWGLEDLMEHLDFVSIGSNDLIQYSFAVDRGNQRVSKWFRQFHPIVLRMVRHVCEVVGRFEGKRVALCGEMASIPLGAPMLIGAGLRELSMNPWKIPGVVEVISRVSLDECRAYFEEAVACRTDGQIVELMDRFATEHDLSK